MAEAAPATSSTEAVQEGKVYLIPIHGMIEKGLIYVIRRGVMEAERVKADAVVFTMDTHGGGVKAAENIVHMIENLSMPTYTFVEHNAISAGAIIAFATDHIYMTPGSKIGDAMPVMQSATGGAQDIPDDMNEKVVTFVSAMIRASAQRKGHDPKLGECMVRRELEYKIGKEMICPEGEILTLTNVEAERFVGKGKERRRLLTEGTVENLDALLEQINLSEAEVVKMEVTEAERVARYIAAMAPILMMIGMVGIYTEIKTPGFGIPGLIGGLCLALFFWGHHIAGLSGMEDVVIFGIGVALLIAEVFVIPGFGVAGILGLTLVLWSLLKAMVEHYPGGPLLPTMGQLQLPLQNLSLGIILAAGGAYVAGRFLPKSTLFHKLVLDEATTKERGYQSSSDTTHLIGLEGITLSDLYPAGAVRVGEQRLDVLTRGEFVDKDTRIKVVESHGSRIIVEALPEED